jgi:hypothetical protein
MKCRVLCRTTFEGLNYEFAATIDNKHAFIEYTQGSVLVKGLFAKIIECACNNSDAGTNYVVHISGSDDAEFELYKDQAQDGHNIIIGEVPDSVISWILDSIDTIE